MRKVRGFTLIELLVVISIIALLIGILLPALGAARRTARRMENDTRVRGVHQACVTFASGNQSFFPGRDGSNGGNELGDIKTTTNGQMWGLDVEGRYWILLRDSYFTTEFIKSPLDANGYTQWSWDSNTAVTSSQYSYAMLQVPIGHNGGTGGGSGGQRTVEWADTINTEAAAVSDKTTKIASGANPGASVHDDKNWKGSTVFNDNHVEFRTSKVLATVKYGPISQTGDDMWDVTACPIAGQSGGGNAGTGDNCQMKNSKNTNDNAQPNY